MSEGVTYYVTNLVEAALALANTPTALEYIKQLEQRPLTKALSELNEDSGGLWFPALVAALCPVAPVVGLTLAGVSTPLKFTYLGCAGLSLFGMHKFYSQKVGLSPLSQQCFNKSMAVMLVSGAVHLALAHGGLPMLASSVGLPAEVLKHIVYPEVALYSMANLVLYPLVLLNLGYVAGASPKQMVPCTTLNMVSNTMMVLSATDLLDGTGPLMCVGASIALNFASTLVMAALVEGAAQLSFANKNRVEHSIDSTMFFWSLAPLVQALTLMDSLGVDQARVVFALLDLPGKLGVLHIMLKSRPAMESAGNHFEDPNH